MAFEESKKYSAFQPISLAELSASTTSPFLHPSGWKHFLSIPADFETVIEFLKKEGLLLHDPLPMRVRNDLPTVPTFISKWQFDITSSGHDHDPAIALTKSIVEGLERLITSNKNYIIDESVDYKKAKKAIINPYDASSYFKEQQTEPFTLEDATFAPCKDILTGETKYIPDNYIFWGNKNNYRLYASNTNGGGAHTDKTLATLSGIHEYVERDAFLLYWLAKKTPVRLDLHSLPEATRTIIEGITSRGLELHICVLDNNTGIPTFLPVIFDKRTEPHALVVAGGANAFDYESALRRGLFEAQSILQEVLDMDPVKEIIDTKKPFTNSKIGRKDRMGLWKGEWIAQELAWLAEGQLLSWDGLLEKFPELKHGVHDELALAEHIKKHSPEANIYAYYPKSPILAKLGVVVVRVYIENFLNLYLTESAANINVERLRRFGGFKGDMYHALNPLPHPFP
jgi:thiazole/oxazole-forming peptide maturase SagD family component